MPISFVAYFKLRRDTRGKKEKLEGRILPLVPLSYLLRRDRFQSRIRLVMILLEEEKLEKKMKDQPFKQGFVLLIYIIIFAHSYLIIITKLVTESSGSIDRDKAKT
jgi:hypothetical protein